MPETNAPVTPDHGTSPSGSNHSGRLPHPEHRGPTLSTFATSSWPAVLHRHLLGTLDLATLSALQTVPSHWNRPSFLTSQTHAGDIYVRRPRDRIIEPGALHGLAYLAAQDSSAQDILPHFVAPIPLWWLK